MTFIQALLIGLIAGLTVLDGNWLGEAKFREPVVTGFLVGLALGDVTKGLKVGAELQLLWMGATVLVLQLNLILVLVEQLVQLLRL